MRGGWRPGARGFSVIEALIVVALLVGLASIGGVVLSGWLLPLRNEASVAALERAVALAVDRARREGVPYAVTLPGDEQSPAESVALARVGVGEEPARPGARRDDEDRTREERPTRAWPIGGRLEGRWLRIGGGEEGPGASRPTGTRALVVVGPEAGVLSAGDLVLTRGSSRLSLRIDTASGVVTARPIERPAEAEGEAP